MSYLIRQNFNLGIHRAGVSPNSGRINRRELRQGYIQFAGTEKSQSRTLQISVELATILSKTQRESGVIFKTYYREPFTRVKLTRAINEFKARGLYRRDWSLQDLRHSFGVNFLAKGGSMRELQFLMGHANVFDTRRIFGEGHATTSALI